MPSEANRPAHSAPSSRPGGLPILRVLWFALAVMVFLSLWPWGSYHPRDADVLSGGIDGDVLVHNWIGYFGALVSRFFLLLFGFAAYVFSSLSLLSSIRRLFGRKGMRPIRWDYWVALLTTTFGASMLLGIWPDFGAAAAEALNLARMPGGVIGQRLCAPLNGCMRIVLHPAGSAIVALVLISCGAVVIWLHDWQDLVVSRRETRSAEKSDEPEPETEVPGKGVLGSLAQRRAEKLARRREIREQEELPLAEPEPAAPPPKVNRKPAPVEEPHPQPAASATKAPRKTSKYQLPGIGILRIDEGPGTTADPKETETKKQILQETLDSFGIDAQVGNATSGPRVTLFEVLPAPGVKVEKISQISNNIAMELRATSLRILTPIPGRKSVGIEVPNNTPAMVTLHSLINSQEWTRSRARIPVLLGRNIRGQVVNLDLTKAPHLLIAGATGSGKSVCINLLIMSLLYRFTPDELRLIMVDPKVVEFRAYESLPHLVVPVISDVKKVPIALRWAINEMQRRYQMLAKVGARNLEGFNARPKKPEPVLGDDGEPIPDHLPYIVIIIDELADIMMTAKADVETSLARIAQLSRAVGIHTIIATQRPSVNVITGTIKANFPTRIAFKVTSQIDSRTILDGKGAEALLGQGDMLFRPPGAAGMERIQGGMVEDDEIDKVVQHVSEQADQEFDESVFKAAPGDGDQGGGTMETGEPLSDEDEDLIQQAVEVILRDRRPTTSYLQRCLRIGYNRAASIIDILEQRGVIGPQIGSAPREILIAADGISGSDGEEDEDDEDEDN